MTGPEHYQAAEQALRQAHSAAGQPAEQQRAITLAQAHATLAHAAATALAAITAQCGDSRGSFYLASGEDRHEWEKAATRAGTLT
jgi:hypothetical protein